MPSFSSVTSFLLPTSPPHSRETLQSNISYTYNTIYLPLPIHFPVGLSHSLIPLLCPLSSSSPVLCTSSLPLPFFFSPRSLHSSLPTPAKHIPFSSSVHSHQRPLSPISSLFHSISSFHPLPQTSFSVYYYSCTSSSSTSPIFAFSIFLHLLTIPLFQSILSEDCQSKPGARTPMIRTHLTIIVLHV